MSKKEKSVRRNRGFDDRRREIVQSAASLFSTEGFAGATMEEIAERANMAKGNLYYYFPSKQDLLFFCQEQSLGMMIKGAEAVVDSNQSPEAKVRELILIHIRTVLKEFPLTTAHTDFRSLPPDKLGLLVHKRDRYESAYRTVIDEGVAAGAFRVGNVRTSVWAILGALNWAVQWYSAEGALTVEQIAEDFGDLFVGGLSRTDPVLDHR